MNGKVARTLRKIAQANTVGKSAEFTRRAYQDLKKLYKNGDIKLR